MELSEIVSITGMSGLFKVAGRKNEGLIVTSLTDGKTQFVSGRTNLFSSLDNITLYTTDEPVALKDVFLSIKEKSKTSGVPDGKDDKQLKSWMEIILPTYDKEKVYTSDMRKLAKWYTILESKNLLDELLSEKAEGETDDKKEELAEVKKETKKKTAKSGTSSKAQSKPAPVKKITTPRKAS